jgi:hypothetical protein
MRSRGEQVCLWRGRVARDVSVWRRTDVDGRPLLELRRHRQSACGATVCADEASSDRVQAEKPRFLVFFIKERSVP